MNIEIKKSVKPVKYKFAIDKLEERLEGIKQNKKKNLYGYWNIMQFLLLEQVLKKTKF